MAITFDSFDSFQDMLKRINDDVEAIDWKAFAQTQGDRLQGDHSDFFDDEKSPLGKKWADLAPSTIARKGHSKILIDSRRLVRSLTQKTDDAIRAPFQSGNMAGLVFGTAVPYAHYHMTGTRNMPARPMVGLTESRLEKVRSQVASLITETIIKPKR